LAIVTNNDLAFGLSRMLEMSNQRENITIEVFRDEQKARKWITGIQEKECKWEKENSLRI
jgi:hypothetical protein